MKLITLTATSITSIKCGRRVFDARVYRCSEQCQNVTWGHSFFTSVTKPDLTPIIAGTLSVQVCLKFSQLTSVSKKESTRALTSAAVVVTDSVLLSNNFIFLISGEGDQVADQVEKSVSVDLSSWMLAWSVFCLILEQTCWHTLILWEPGYDNSYFDFDLKPAVVSCLTNALAPLPIALESCTRAQMNRTVL